LKKQYINRDNKMNTKKMTEHSSCKRKYVRSSSLESGHRIPCFLYLKFLLYEVARDQPVLDGETTEQGKQVTFMALARRTRVAVLGTGRGFTANDGDNSAKLHIPTRRCLWIHM
jgi:hypothetical protein